MRMTCSGDGREGGLETDPWHQPEGGELNKKSSFRSYQVVCFIFYQKISGDPWDKHCNAEAEQSWGWIFFTNIFITNMFITTINMSSISITLINIVTNVCRAALAVSLSTLPQSSAYSAGGSSTASRFFCITFFFDNCCFDHTNIILIINHTNVTQILTMLLNADHSKCYPDY